MLRSLHNSFVRGPALMDLWSEALPAAVSGLSSLPWFVFLSGACVKVLSDFH